MSDLNWRRVSQLSWEKPFYSALDNFFNQYDPSNMELIMKIGRVEVKRNLFGGEKPKWVESEFKLQFRFPNTFHVVNMDGSEIPPMFRDQYLSILDRGGTEDWDKDDLTGYINNIKLWLKNVSNTFLNRHARVTFTGVKDGRKIFEESYINDFTITPETLDRNLLWIGDKFNFNYEFRVEDKLIFLRLDRRYDGEYRIKVLKVNNEGRVLGYSADLMDIKLIILTHIIDSLEAGKDVFCRKIKGES